MFSSSFCNENLILGLMTLKIPFQQRRLELLLIVSRITAKCDGIRRVFLLDFDNLEDNHGESVNLGTIRSFQTTENFLKVIEYVAQHKHIINKQFNRPLLHLHPPAQINRICLDSKWHKLQQPVWFTEDTMLSVHWVNSACYQSVACSRDYWGLERKNLGDATSPHSLPALLSCLPAPQRKASLSA